MNDLYAAIARRRRERYARRPDLRLRLRRPVISVGNLAVGGRGKTPIVAAITRELLAMGERPAILSRGYGRTRPEDGVVVVRDPGGIRSDFERSGDEPLMLARQLPGASLLVSSDRYLAGRLAEHHLGATVHVLDDGFQHHRLDRDLDIVLVGAEDLACPVTLPGGRLREPLDTLIAADAILASDDEALDGVRARAAAHIPVFRTTRVMGAPDAAVEGMAVFAVAGIAGPQRFLEGLRSAGWVVAGSRSFRDHHSYSRSDAAGIFAAARAAGAGAVVTTEKDFVRLLRYRPFSMPTIGVPLTMEPDPLPEFRHWLAGSLLAARDGADAELC